MKIALIGYGKMGKEIEKIAIARGHKIALIIDADNLEELSGKKLPKCDVAIEFTNPDHAFENLKKCLDAQVPVISGTTGWLDKKPMLDKYCQNRNGTYLYSSNYSIGVNMFFAINKKLASLIAPHSEYTCKVTEIHHTTKVDAPSGTGITLAEGIIETHPNYEKWVNKHDTTPFLLPIISERIKDAPGTHIIDYVSDIDEISIKHEAKSRKGFATGAVVAAEWIADKKGIFSMADVLGF